MLGREVSARFWMVVLAHLQHVSHHKTAERHRAVHHHRTPVKVAVHKGHVVVMQRDPGVAVTPLPCQRHNLQELLPHVQLRDKGVVVAHLHVYQIAKEIVVQPVLHVGNSVLAVTERILLGVSGIHGVGGRPQHL